MDILMAFDQGAVWFCNFARRGINHGSLFELVPAASVGSYQSGGVGVYGSVCLMLRKP